MRIAASLPLLAFLTTLAPLALAQEPPPPPLPPPAPPVTYAAPPPPVTYAAPPPPVVYVSAPPPEYVAAPAPPAGDAPRARTGFQLALRSGYMVPFGNASGAAGDSMNNIFSGQVPLIVDIGGKPNPHLFLGGYLGLGFGGAAGITGQNCAKDNVSCSAVGLRIGAEIQYHFAPDATINPWIGYGIGIESSAVGGTVPNGGQFTVATAGPEYAHLMAGVDFRLSRSIGIGPTVDYSLGQYSSVQTTVNGVTTSGTLANPAMHEWLLLGVRLVFFP